MKIAQWNYLGPRSTPQEVRNLRKSSFDYHRTLGQPVVHKHKWNLKDVRDGKARICPFHDETLNVPDSEWDPYCFGTGILGGWADGVITFISLADARQDTIQFGPQGMILFETHPDFTAPWVPDMGDGDFIITGEFNPDTWEFIEEFDRYDLQEVTPKTMRGLKKNPRGYKVHQQGNLDKIPYKDVRYQVPIVFDYNNVPTPNVPPGSDPGDTPLPPGANRSMYVVDVKVVGDEPGLHSSTTANVAITGKGNTASRTVEVKVGATAPGAYVYFED